MRTIEQRREAVRQLLRNPKNRGLAARAIAREAQVSPHLVRLVAEEVGHEFPEIVEYTHGLSGEVTRMDASRIGRRSPEVRLQRALGRIGRVLSQYRGLKALRPLAVAYREVKRELRRRA